MRAFIYSTVCILASVVFTFPGAVYAQIVPAQVFVATTSPVSGITQRTYGNPLIFTGISTGGCLTLDSNSVLTTTSCGSGGSGGGIGTTTPWTTNFLVQVVNNGTVKSIATSSLGLTTSSFASANISQWTNNSGYLTADPFWVYANSAISTSSPVLITGSTTIAAQFNTPNASTTLLTAGTVWDTGITSALALFDSSHKATAYAGSAPCTNQVALSISATGVITCTSVTNAMLSNATISGVSLGSNLNSLSHDSTLSGTSYNGSAAVSDWGLNLSNSNTWTALQKFSANASTTQISSFGKSYFGGSATTTIDSSGNIVIPSGSSLTNTGVSNGCATWASGVLGTTGVACGSGSSSGWPFTPSSYAGVANQSTTTPFWLNGTQLIASSTLAVNATTTNLYVTGVTSKILSTDSNGQVGAYAGATCTNQFVRSLNGAGAATCATVANTDLTNSSLTVTAGTGLSGGGAVSLGGSTSLSLDLTHANTWTGLQQFQANASSTNFSNYGTAYFGGSATSTINSAGLFTGNASDTNLTAATAWFTGITGVAGNCLHVDTNGKVSGTGSDCGSSGGTVTSVTGTYPIISSGGTTPAISTAFGTTTANNFSALNTFANATSTLFSATTAWIGTLNLTNPLAIASGGTATTSVTTYPWASSWAGWDANKNLSANNFLAGYANVTTIGTTTLTVASPETEYVTSAGNATIVLPNVSTIPLGTTYVIWYAGSGSMVVKAGDGSSFGDLADAFLTYPTYFTSISTSANSILGWNYVPYNVEAAFGKIGYFNNTLFFSGTDGTTMTFPGTSATIARTDAAQTFTGLQSFSNATSTLFTAGTIWNTGITSALALFDSNHKETAYAGSAPCTNQVALSISATGVITCTSVTNSMLSNSTISGVSLGSALNSHSHDSTLSGTSYNGSAAVSDWGLNLSNSNTWTALQKFYGAASSTLFSSFGPAYFGGSATSTFDTAGNLTLPSSSLNIGTTSLAKPFIVEGSTSGGVGIIQRDTSSALYNSLYGTYDVRLNESSSTQQLANGTGPTQTFGTSLNGGSENILADFGAYENGATTTGVLVLRSYVSGSPTAGFYASGFNEGAGNFSTSDTFYIQKYYGSTATNLLELASSTSATGSSANSVFSINTAGTITTQLGNALVLSGGAGSTLTTYGGASCTNQVPTSQSGIGGWTCNSVTDSFFSGQLGISHGGTGLSSIGASSTVLTTNGTVAAWQKLDLAAAVYGKLPAANGGTGQDFSGSSGLAAINSGVFSAISTTSMNASITGSSGSVGHSISPDGATITGTSFNGSATVSDWALNLSHANTWTGLQQFGNATSTLFSATTAWIGTLNLTNKLTIANGGTNQTSFTSQQPVAYDGTSLVSTSTPGGYVSSHAFILGVSSTTAITASTTSFIYAPAFPMTVSGISCPVQPAGATLEIEFQYANPTAYTSGTPFYFAASTTPGVENPGNIAISAQATTTITVGNPTGSPLSVACTISGTSTGI